MGYPMLKSYGLLVDPVNDRLIDYRILEKFPVFPPRDSESPRESNLRRTPSRPSVSFCSSVGFSEGGGTFDLENCACTKCNAASVYDPPPPTLVSEAEVTARDIVQ